MADIVARGKVPLLVGGTMLYFKALREGLSQLPRADPDIRATLDAEIEQFGIQHLHRQLALVDAVTAARLAQNDTQRIQRALEVYRITGVPMSVLLNNSAPSDDKNSELPYRITSITITPSDRAQLHARIATRAVAAHFWTSVCPQRSDTHREHSVSGFHRARHPGAKRFVRSHFLRH